MDIFIENGTSKNFEVTEETVYSLYYAAEQITEKTPQSELCKLLGVIEYCKRKTKKFTESLRCLQSHLQAVFQEVLNNSDNRPALACLRDFLNFITERMIDELSAQPG